MATIGRGQWQYAAILFMLGNIGVARQPGVLRFAAAARRPAATSWTASLRRALPWGSSAAGVLLLVNLAWILSPGTFGLPDTLAAIKLSFVSVAVWWFVFTPAAAAARAGAAGSARG